MKSREFTRCLVFGGVLALLSGVLSAQGTQADYERAFQLQEKSRAAALNITGPVVWTEGTNRFCYRKTVRGGFEFILVDADHIVKRPAFDHEKLAASLSRATGEKHDARNLPFDRVVFVDKERAVEFEFGDGKWKCDLAAYACVKIGPSSRARPSPFAPAPPPSRNPIPSPDGKWEAFIRDHNVYVRSADRKDEFPMSLEGIAGDEYNWESLVWAPDSNKLAAFRIRPGARRKIQYVESSPADQLQPKYHAIEYLKPGDPLDEFQPVLFHVDTKKQFIVDKSLFPNPYFPNTNFNMRYSKAYLAWRKDSRAFTFEYNQRGHQVYRVIEVDGRSGQARALVDEECRTFFSYYGKLYRYDVQDGREIIWMSERDGWNHLYLYDGATGQVKNQITRGEWVVRGVDRVDEENRRIFFRAGGMVPGKDPYLLHSYRINFDGTGLTPLTETDGNHTVVFSPDLKYFVDTWSRIDLPPVVELRRTADRRLLMDVERADIQELLKMGYRMPEVFSAKGRDGQTDIWGVVFRPRSFDPSRKYPVIEYIYAGPHDSFVPKSFSPFHSMQALAELGFIVVQCDGMGTSNRSKAFHDVCWKDIADGGFPDRIPWIKALAAKDPSCDISRVGIYGHSAGGQNTLTALLFHPDFYKAGVSSCGCHVNRMDKISWNEQWMGWPIGPEYAASSNVDNAWRLQGNLLLSVGELDTNVDPASTMQVVNALIKANKVFDLIVLPGQGHTTGGTYGDRKRYDFFVRHLLGVEPPEWNKEKIPSGNQ